MPRFRRSAPGTVRRRRARRPVPQRNQIARPCGGGTKNSAGATNSAENTPISRRMAYLLSARFVRMLTTAWTMAERRIRTRASVTHHRVMARDCGPPRWDCTCHYDSALVREFLGAALRQLGGPPGVLCTPIIRLRATRGRAMTLCGRYSEGYHALSQCRSHRHTGRPGRGWRPPALVVDLDALERNIAAMAAHAKQQGITLRPHAKTHKCASIARLQIAAGRRGCVAPSWVRRKRWRRRESNRSSSLRRW